MTVSNELPYGVMLDVNSRFVISPDGRELGFVARGPDWKSDVASAQSLPGTDDLGPERCLGLSACFHTW